MIKWTALCAFLAALLTAPVAAQDYAFQGFAADMAMATLHASVRDLSIAEEADATAPTKGAGVVTGYRPSAAVSEKAQRQFIAFLRQTSCDAGAFAAADTFARAHPSEIWTGLVAMNGLRSGDAVDAIAGYWMLNWIIANRAHDADFDTAPILRQVRTALASDPQFPRLTEAERQEMSEILMMNFLVQHAVYSDAVVTGNSTMLAQLGNAAVARFKQEAGVDLRALAVTPQGFAAR